jgi:hypothetical protein
MCGKKGGAPEIVRGEFAAQNDRRVAHTLANDPAALHHAGDQLEHPATPIIRLLPVARQKPAEYSRSLTPRLSISLPIHLSTALPACQMQDPTLEPLLIYLVGPVFVISMTYMHLSFAFLLVALFTAYNYYMHWL